MAKGFKIVINRAAVNRLVKAAITAAEQTAYAVMSDVEEEQVVPMEVGTLATAAVDSSEKAKGRFKLVYNTPYARRLYWHPEYNFRTDKNPNARGEWLEPWLTGEKKDFARKAFVKLFKKRRKMG